MGIFLEISHFGLNPLVYKGLENRRVVKKSKFWKMTFFKPSKTLSAKIYVEKLTKNAKKRGAHGSQKSHFGTPPFQFRHNFWRKRKDYFLILILAAKNQNLVCTQHFPIKDVGEKGIYRKCGCQGVFSPHPLELRFQG